MALAVPLNELKDTFRELRRDPKRKLKELIKGWASISLAASMIATVFDLGLMILLVQLAHLNPALAAPAGVALGATINFAINKVFSFKDSVGHVQNQYLRFILGTAVAAGIHAGFVYVFTNKLHVNYIIAKLMADILVFTVGNLVLLRLIVFPKNKNAEGQAPAKP